MKYFCISFAILALLQGFLPAICFEEPEVKQTEKRQLVTGILSAALPSLTSLLLKETHLDQFIGKAVSFVTSFIKGQSGDMPLEGTQLKLHYNVHRCSLHFGKRFLAKETCKAEVSEAHTNTKMECTESSQDKALKCAVKKEIEHLTALAKAVAAQQAAAAHPAKRQLVTGILSAALPSLTSLLLKETHLDQFIGKAVSFVTSFIKGQSGDMPLEGTQLKLHYNVHRCSLHFGKRFLAKETCKAEVSEAHTNTKMECTESSQDKALKCAVKKEIEHLTALAKAVAAQQAAAAHPAKRQLVTGILSAALPSLTHLLLKETHLDQFIGKAVGFVTSFIKGQSGDMPLEGTQLKLHYNVHRCTLHFGKRFLAKERCKAEVSEAHTNTKMECTESSQDKALKCAVKKEVEHLTALAKAVAAQQAAAAHPAKRQLVTGILSAALPSLTHLLLKETHLDQFIGKAVGFVTSFIKGQSGDMPLEGTQLKLHYNVHRCTLHFGKRFLAKERCKAEVSEAHTNTKMECTESSQDKALKCAVKKEVEHLTALAKAVAAQQAAHPA